MICSDHFPPSEKDKLNLIKNKDLEPFYYKDGKAYGPPLPPSSASFVISTPAVTTLPTTKALPSASGLNTLLYQFTLVEQAKPDLTNYQRRG